MMKFSLWLLLALETLVLFALMKPIVCPGVELFSTRQHRSSKIDKSEYISDNLHSLMKTETSENRSGKVQQPQHYQKLLEPEIPEKSGINDTIKDLFDMDGDRIFDNTYAITPIPHMQADDPFVDKSSKEEQEFKVQRTADGKLNLVFNDYFIFQKAEAQSTTRTPPNRDWVYPMDMDHSFPYHHRNPQQPSSHIHSDVEPSCEDESYNMSSLCTKVRNYPKNLEVILQQQYSKFEFFFGADITPPKVSSRNNFLPNEEYLCASTEMTIFPESGQTIDNNMRWIVNYGNFKQGIRVEECKNAGEPCSGLKGSLRNGYKATCKQHYIYRPLVAVTSNGTLLKDQFKIPSCCKCVLTQVPNG